MSSYTPVEDAVREWERRRSNGDESVERRTRSSYPPPAPSSGAAGIVAGHGGAYISPSSQTRSPYPTQVTYSHSISPLSPPPSSKRPPMPRASSSSTMLTPHSPNVYGKEELEQSQECVPLNSYSSDIDRHDQQTLTSNAFIPPNNHVYVAGPSAMNPEKIIDQRKANLWSTPFWPKMAGVGRTVYQQCAWLAIGLVVLWIPGLIAILCYSALKYDYYAYPTCFGVGLFWWSTWLSTAWAGLWVCYLIAYVTPSVLRFATRILAVPLLKEHIGYIDVLRRYFATLLWSIFIWIAYLLLVWVHFPGHDGIDNSLLDPLTASTNSTGTPTNATSTSTSSANSILGAVYGAGAVSVGGTQTTASAQAALLNSTSNTAWLITFSRCFFGFVICATLLLGEKLCVQKIAHSFHQVTYHERIDLAKFHTNVLITLYAHATRIGSASGHLKAEKTEHRADVERQQSAPPSRQRKSKKDWRYFRNLISVNGTRVRTMVHGSDPTVIPPLFNPFTPEAIVESSLESHDETRKLALRIFDAFSVRSASGVPMIELKSFIRLYKGDQNKAKRAFAVLDRDNNGSCTWDEVISACFEIHRERMCLLASMHDVDSAVAKLDHILSSVWATMSCVIVAALLSQRFSTLIASLGTILLGLSWLVSSTAQESLASLVFVFCKHPIDVGDIIVVPGLLSQNSGSLTHDPLTIVQGYTDGDTFEVEEIQLLSTVLRTTSTGKHVHVSNFVLAQKPIVNLRRSGPIEEPFVISVAYDTPLDSVETLRDQMVEWLQTAGRDFRPGLDIAIEGIDDQTQIKLALLIRYKSNWQDSTLRLRRRNRWITALKQLLAQNGIRGPTSVNVPVTSPPLPNNGVIKEFELMDKGIRDSKAGRDDFELFGRKHESRSRLNEALQPVASTSSDTATMFRRHSATTTHLDANAGPAHDWRAGRGDVEQGGGVR